MCFAEDPRAEEEEGSHRGRPGRQDGGVSSFLLMTHSRSPLYFNNPGIFELQGSTYLVILLISDPHVCDWSRGRLFLRERQSNDTFISQLHVNKWILDHFKTYFP